MKIFNTVLKITSASAALILLDLTAFAQCCPPPPPTGVPVDGGVSILAAAAVAYGIKEITKKKNV